MRSFKSIFEPLNLLFLIMFCLSAYSGTTSNVILFGIFSALMIVKLFLDHQLKKEQDHELSLEMAELKKIKETVTILTEKVDSFETKMGALGIQRVQARKSF